MELWLLIDHQQMEQSRSDNGAMSDKCLEQGTGNARCMCWKGFKVPDSRVEPGNTSWLCQVHSGGTVNASELVISRLFKSEC